MTAPALTRNGQLGPEDLPVPLEVSTPFLHRPSQQFSTINIIQRFSAYAHAKE
jgi:hypothetical protein